MSHGSPSPALFFDTVNAYHRTEALRAAIEINFFEPLATGPKSAAALASACNVAERGARILADFLSILGFLQKDNEQYRLSTDSAAFLNPRSPAYLGGTLRFLLTPSLTSCFSRLTDAVRKGGTAASDEGTVSYDNPIWVEFARGMGPLMQLPATLLAGLIDADLQKPLRILDVAAGHGLFGIAFAKRFPNSVITALDWSNVLTVAQENAKGAGLQDRYHVLPGSAFEVSWGGPYDLILLTNFLHHFDRATCVEIARKALKSLAPDGRMVTLEFIPDSDRVSPPGTATFALTMLATTASGDAYTFAEYEQMFQEAGFRRNEFHPLPPTIQQSIVSSR